MIISLYKFKKRVNSLKIPSGGTNKEVVLKEKTSLYTPTFHVSFNPNGYNYYTLNNYNR